ncbi:MAG: hypothetical protein BWX45_00522 [Deltaproteobacteria bacterium ADurb.Bin002]|nr:MAG: hypothetical protein BWX45_00522 [Deltaproteobacteria bacterium ADurb.Bin002]
MDSFKKIWLAFVFSAARLSFSLGSACGYSRAFSYMAMALSSFPALSALAASAVK